MKQFKSLGREFAMGSQSKELFHNHSKEFQLLIKSIGDSKSKSEEDRIVFNQIQTLKTQLTEPNISNRNIKEYIITLLYIEMLGHDASFGYIHAVNITHRDNLKLKRIGYLAVTLFLHDNHDLIILIVNTIQKDLKSDSYVVVCAALNAVCRLINEDTIPAVLPQVVELLGHSKEAVRKKAVMALHRFFQKSPSSVSHLVANFRKRLCDNDPGVMGAALCPLFDLVTVDANSYKDLVVTFVNILKQVVERRLPKNYDYHQMPAPFIQVKLLKILALLGSGDKKASENMYTVLADIIRKSDSSTNIGNAVLYECIRCVASIYPNPMLLEAAADVIANFLKSDNHNLKYMGIDALGRLIKLSLNIAEQHQLAVIDCLEDPDDTMKRKTFELLYKMTKSSNVEVIVDRMIDYMISISDDHYKAYIASRCVELAEQFAPSNHWFIQTINKVFEHAGDVVNIKVAHNLMRLIAEGFGEEDDAKYSQLRSSAVESYLRILGEPKLPSVFLQVICWVLGEYGTADGKYSASYMSGKLCDIAEAYSNDENVKAYAISALMKIYAFEVAAGRKVDMLPECQSLIEELLASHSTDLQQRAHELQALIGLDAQIVETIMPRDASCIGIEVDKDLSFLNGYVQQSIEKGAQPYIPEDVRTGMENMSSFRSQDQQEPLQHGLRFEAYEIPKPPMQSKVAPVSFAFSTDIASVPKALYSRETHHVSSMGSASEAGSSELKLQLDGVQKKWGKPTYTSSTSSTSYSTSQTPTNGTAKVDDPTAVNSKVRISPEKQKLAASLFGGSTKPEKRSSTSHKVPKASASAADRSQGSKTAGVPDELAMERKIHHPPPDLLDLGESTVSTGPPPVDPFQQLEELLDPSISSTTNHNTGAVTNTLDIMTLYAETTASGHSGSGGYSIPVSGDNLDLLYELSNAAIGVASAETIATPLPQSVKFSNAKDSVQKDAFVRQMGVNPSRNLFRDLLG
ncbi:PREDICTED: AP-4 complex subunit epsilon-like isoform X2 [Lupinus angustifolius]|uniref:AP-4 complex subunit epsilon-like isoform X2 n=1 Tax=Lupinus angustifolius TaxID=3871 RepID=UPI00092FC7FC|nr:PREDICTED: AP-4 complex subunit epsilon-like isoform X2 [Lupinus angustifolius]